MKRLFILTLCLFAFAFSFEFNTDSWGDFLTFNPDKRESLLSYPISWLRPSVELFTHDYQDSSSTYGSWEQILTNDESYGYSPGMSNHIIAKYTPYSFPHRWSAGLEFTNYKGSNSTYRTDAVLHYRHLKGNIQYFHTSNTQKILLASGSTVHEIRAHGLDFDYAFTDKLKLLGGININQIEQVDDTTRNYDIHHEQLALNYSLSKSFSVYGKYHFWYYHNVDREGPAWLFFPGIRFNAKIINAHATLRVAKTTIHPIVELSLHPGPFYLHLFTKTRSSRLDLQQAANQYFGVTSGLNLNAKHHLLQLNASYTYDVVRTAEGESILNDDFQNVAINGEYRFKSRSIDLFTMANYQHAINPREGYFHPVRMILTGGLDFRSLMADENLKLNGGINAQYIVHDDPDLVSFDPSKLTYTLNGEADLIGDWKINANLKAIIQSFAISANVSIPVKLTDDLRYFLYEGIYTSSDFYIGNTLYAGLTIEWLWWK